MSDITWEDRMKGAYASLRPSERKVADYLLQNPDRVRNLTVGALAQAAGVSEPTVIRCVRGLGYRGYRAFKTALNSPADRGEDWGFDHLGGFALRPWERMEGLPLKAVGTQREMLEETLKAVAPEALALAAQLLSRAAIIDIYGVENSRAPAIDLLTKFTYLGLRCRCHTDPYLQLIGAAHLRPGDAAVAFSYSGRSADTVKALKLAKKAGADTIAVTANQKAPLVKYADLLLPSGGRTWPVYGSAIFSRVADLAVVDMLYMGVILSDYGRFSRCLDKSGRVIAHRESDEK